MVKNSARKKAARAYQEMNPGVTRPEATRAVARPGSVQSPWVRTHEPDSFTCYFCGRDTAILSWGDKPADRGRVQLYCDNPDCAARTVEVIVVHDRTTGTMDRADVRALEYLRPTATHPRRASVESMAWTPGAAPWVRQTISSSLCLFCGEISCILSRRDDPQDTGRIELYCQNPSCHVRAVDVLVMRDNTPETLDRDDVKILNLIDTPPSLRPGNSVETSAGGVRTRRPMRASDDPLPRRRSERLPWER